MKLLTLLIGALATTSVSAGLFGSSVEIAPFEDKLDVPGDNPLQHCQDPEDDILEIDSVDLDPNPPSP